MADRVLLTGGSGFFGRRIAEALLGDVLEEFYHADDRAEQSEQRTEFGDQR